jgi:hypothetical protein
MMRDPTLSKSVGIADIRVYPSGEHGHGLLHSSVLSPDLPFREMDSHMGNDAV